MSKLYQVVDDTDTIAGHKQRDQIDFQNEYYRVSATWITNTSGQVLLAQRKLTKDKDPGRWGPAAAGTLEEGESYKENAYKELEEETGLSGIELHIGPKMKIDQPRKYFCQWYTGVCDWPIEQFRPQPSEVEAMQWIDFDALVLDIESNPSKYVPSMAQAIEAFMPL